MLNIEKKVVSVQPLVGMDQKGYQVVQDFYAAQAMNYTKLLEDYAPTWAELFEKFKSTDYLKTNFTKDHAKLLEKSDLRQFLVHFQGSDIDIPTLKDVKQFKFNETRCKRCVYSVDGKTDQQHGF